VQLFDVVEARKRRTATIGSVDYDPLSPPSEWAGKPVFNPADPWAEEPARPEVAGTDWSPW
jgi:hypothetical protein